MFRFKELMERNLEALASIITHEHGKVLSDAKGEVQRGIEVVEFARCAAAAEDAVFGQHRRWHRQLFVAPAARRRRRHHAVQLPAMVPMWMFPLACCAATPSC